MSKNKPTELDLHGYYALEALNHFIREYDSLAKKGQKELIVIHGYGSTGTGGVLLKTIRNYCLKQQINFIPGDEIDFNPGYTKVIIDKRISPENRSLNAELLEFLQTPKPLSKILNQFRNEDEVKIQQRLKKLVKEQILEIILKGRSRCYKVKE